MPYRLESRWGYQSNLLQAAVMRRKIPRELLPIPGRGGAYADRELFV